jgi:predicted phage terminase large subunit-like protein
VCIPNQWRCDHPHIAYFDRPTSIGWHDPRVEEGELAFPERFSRPVVDDLKKELRGWGGTYAESAQLDQLPAPRGGGMFQRDKFQVVAPFDVPAGGQVVRGWDLAASTGMDSAYTAGVRMRRVKGRIYIEDVQRVRGTPRQVELLISNCAQHDGATCTQDLPQDPGQAGKAQKSYIAQVLHGHKFQFSPETGSKEDRAAPLAAQVEAGNVALVRGPWNDAFITEAASFPVGKFKDQMDASSRAYSALLRKPVELMAAAPEIITIGGF